MKDAIDALCDLLIKDNAFTEVAVFGMDEPDVVLALKQPWMSFDNDSQGTAPDGLLASEHPHPRAYGTFPRVLRKYVREEKAADAGRCDSEVLGAAGAADAADRSRRVEAGDVGAMWWSSIRRRLRTRRRLKSRISCRWGWIMCW